MRKWMKTDVLVVLFVVFLDQTTKFLAPNFGLPIVKNTGVAFGLFPNFCWGAVIAFLLLGILANILRKSKDQLSIVNCQLSITLVLGGGLSNLLDRLFLGYIRDFIDLKFWPVFNLADVAITLGVVRLLLKQIKADKKQI